MGKGKKKGRKKVEDESSSLEACTVQYVYAVSYATSLPTPTGSFQNRRTVLRVAVVSFTKRIYYTLVENLDITTLPFMCDDFVTNDLQHFEIQRVRDVD